MEQVLADQVRDRTWREATRTLDQVYRLGRPSREVCRTERYVYRQRDAVRLQIVATVTFVVFGLCGGGVYGFFSHIDRGRGVGSPWLAAAWPLGTALALGLLIQIPAVAGRYVNRRPRLVLLLLPLVAVIGAIVCLTNRTR